MQISSCVHIVFQERYSCLLSKYYLRYLHTFILFLKTQLLFLIIACAIAIHFLLSLLGISNWNQMQTTRRSWNSDNYYIYLLYFSISRYNKIRQLAYNIWLRGGVHRYIITDLIKRQWIMCIIMRFNLLQLIAMIGRWLRTRVVVYKSIW